MTQRNNMMVDFYLFLMLCKMTDFPPQLSKSFETFFLFFFLVAPPPNEFWYIRNRMKLNTTDWHLIYQFLVFLAKVSTLRFNRK